MQVMPQTTRRRRLPTPMRRDRRHCTEDAAAVTYRCAVMPDEPQKGLPLHMLTDGRWVTAGVSRACLESLRIHCVVTSFRCYYHRKEG